jgi:hypothetical protein
VIKNTNPLEKTRIIQIKLGSTQTQPTQLKNQKPNIPEQINIDQQRQIDDLKRQLEQKDKDFASMMQFNQGHGALEINNSKPNKKKRFASLSSKEEDSDDEYVGEYNRSRVEVLY